MNRYTKLMRLCCVHWNLHAPDLVNASEVDRVGLILNMHGPGAGGCLVLAIAVDNSKCERSQIKVDNLRLAWLKEDALKVGKIPQWVAVCT